MINKMKWLRMALKLLGIGAIPEDYFRCRNKKIGQDYKQGYSNKRLARKYGLTENRIYQILTTIGIRKPKWHWMPDEKKKAIFQLQNKGLSHAEIGRRVGITRERVRQIVSSGKHQNVA